MGFDIIVKQREAGCSLFKVGGVNQWLLQFIITRSRISIDFSRRISVEVTSKKCHHHNFSPSEGNL